MKTDSFAFIALRILLLPLHSVAQQHPPILCPSLPSNQDLSTIRCETYDSSVVELDGSHALNCKLSWFVIRAQRTKDNTHQEQQERLTEPHEQCELWLFQFSDDGRVQQTCCGKDGVAVANRVSEAQEQQDPDWDPAQQLPDLQDGSEEPVEHLLMDDSAGSLDDEEGEEEGTETAQYLQMDNWEGDEEGEEYEEE